MKFDKTWTPFALEAEVEQFGTGRISKAHNELLTKSHREGYLEGLSKAIEKVTEQMTWQDGQKPKDPTLEQIIEALEDVRKKV